MNEIVDTTYLDFFLCFEAFEDAVIQNKWNDFLLTQYKILFRRWDLITVDEIESNKECKVMYPIIDSYVEWIKADYTIEKILEINAGYFNKAYASHIESDMEIGYYTDPVISGKSLLELFFLGVFPILNVKKYKEQMRAAKMLKKHPFHLVFDEVGTGKTVAALYCIRDILNRKDSNSKVLVICPNNKKIEWAKDIQRQIGLYAHTVSNSDETNVYSDCLKNIYFKEGEPSIFIEGQKKTEMKSSLNVWSQEKWDLVIIDECHLCFENYNDLRTEKMVLLTATPIVINSQSIEGTLEVSKERNIQEYINLAKVATGCSDFIQVANLFKNNQYFTQLFREDLGIVPKQRKIRFVYTDRLSNRDEYLDVLRTAISGMARLIYEQDDEFLMYGVFEKFRNQIEKAGYCLPEIPELIDNTKYSALSNIINEANDKSYIIFFNSKWPAENVYKRLINDLVFSNEKTIIAMKFGKSICKIYPKNNAVVGENMFDYLFAKIDSGYKVVFITTGATGGTGLNLGKFDGIINYEMPFTCIELEQRFGRVDRMDVIDNKDREMIFLLNTDYNPMLRYSLLKINKTCLYMPIRNTILFCPEVVQEISNNLKREYSLYKLNDTEISYIQKKKTLKSESEKHIVELFEKHIAMKKTADDFSEDISSFSDNCTSFMEYMQENTEMIQRLIIKRKGLTHLKKELKNWLNIIGIESELGSEIEVGSVLLADYDEADNDFDDDNTSNLSSHIIMGNILIEEHNEEEAMFDSNNIELMLQKLEISASSTQNVSGVFYIDNGYHRVTVEEYRKKCPLEEV